MIQDKKHKVNWRSWRGAFWGEKSQGNLLIVIKGQKIGRKKHTVKEETEEKESILFWLFSSGGGGGRRRMYRR